MHFGFFCSFIFCPPAMKYCTPLDTNSNVHSAFLLEFLFSWRAILCEILLYFVNNSALGCQLWIVCTRSSNLIGSNNCLALFCFFSIKSKQEVIEFRRKKKQFSQICIRLSWCWDVCLNVLMIVYLVWFALALPENVPHIVMKHSFTPSSRCWDMRSLLL